MRINQTRRNGLKKRKPNTEKKEHNKKQRKNATVLPGERDEDGKLKTPHTRYGLANNIGYIFKKIWVHNKILVLLIILGAFTQSIMRYLWSYIVKFVIDIVQAQASTSQKDTQQLFQFLIVTTVIEFICIGSNTIVNNRAWFNFINVRLKLVTERINKVLSMDYETLEQPQMLDLFQRANNATGGNNNGVEGMMRNIFKMSALIVTMVVSAAAIISLDWRLIFALTVEMLTNYGSYLWSVNYD